jgi:hypothetical protein
VDTDHQNIDEAEFAGTAGMHLISTMVPRGWLYGVGQQLSESDT